MKNLNKKGVIIGTMMFLVLLGVCLYLFVSQNNENYLVAEDENLLAEKSVQEEKNVNKIKVEVKGEVALPGVYELDDESRLQDLIDAAGGFNEKAYYDNINLSMKLKDEMVLVVYNKDKVNKSSNNSNKTNILNKSSKVNANTSISNEADEKNIKPEYNIDVALENNESVIEKEKNITTEVVKPNDNNDESTFINKLVNINTAGVKELSTLTGIGEAKAQKIIDYRKANGGFKSIDEIMKVKGIGKATYEKFKANITI